MQRIWLLIVKGAIYNIIPGLSCLIILLCPVCPTGTVWTEAILACSTFFKMSFPDYIKMAMSLLLSLQNYSCPSVMVLAIPVAVRFLQRGNRELSRNMSSYLSLAAIAKADLLAEHTEAITLSVLGGRK